MSRICCYTTDHRLFVYMETIFTLQDSLDTPTFYGVNNQNILCLKNQHPDVRVVARGYQVKVTGSEKAIDAFEKSMRLCENFCNRSECSERLRGLDTMVRENIYHEALVRKFRALKAEGKTQREIAEFAQKMVNYGGYTTYGVKCAFEDANLVW